MNFAESGQIQNLHFVVDIDIKGFFDNVDHAKLIRQIWALGIRDKKLICVIKQMLKAPVIMPGGTKFYPSKGTPQGGILSPLLANIVLNELDWWISINGKLCRHIQNTTQDATRAATLAEAWNATLCGKVI